MDVSGELHEHEQRELEKIHVDYCSGSRWTKICTRRDEMMNCEPCRTMPSTLRYPSERPSTANTSVDSPIAHTKGDRVTWRFVATEVNT